MGTSTLLFIVFAVFFSMPLAVFAQIPSDFMTMPMTTEWSDTPLQLENAVPFTRPPVDNTMKDGEIDPIIFEPLEQVRLSLSNFQITTVFDLAPFYTDLLRLMDYGCAFGMDLYHTLSDKHDTSPWHGNQELRRHNIDQLLSLIETTLKETTSEVTRLVQTFDLLQAHPNALQETSGERADPNWQVRSLQNCTLGLEYSIRQGRSPNNARQLLCDCVRHLPTSAAPQMCKECNWPFVPHDPTQRIGGETFPNLDQMAASPNPMSYYERLVRKKSYPAAQQMAIQLLLRLCSAHPEDVPLPFRPCATHYSTPPEWPMPPSQHRVGGQTIPDRNVHWDGRRWVATYAHARTPSSSHKKREAAPHPHPHPTDPPSGRGDGFLTMAHCIISYCHWKLRLKETTPTQCSSRTILFDPFHACPEGHRLRHAVEDVCMNATMWTLCFPHAMELWHDRCVVRNFCAPFYRQQTLHSLRVTRRQCNQDMSHLVPLVRRKRSTLTLHWPKGKGLVLRGSPRSYFIGTRVRSFFSHQARVRTITPTHCPAQPTPLHDPFVMMNEEWLSRRTLEQECYQAAVDTLCQPRAMHLW